MFKRVYEVCFEVSGTLFIECHEAASAHAAQLACLSDLERAGVMPDSVTVSEGI